MREQLPGPELRPLPHDDPVAGSLGRLKRLAFSPCHGSTQSSHLRYELHAYLHLILKYLPGDIVWAHDETKEMLGGLADIVVGCTPWTLSMADICAAYGLTIPRGLLQTP